MTTIEWITLVGVAFAAVSAVVAVVYSYAMLKRDVRSMHKCQRLTLRLVAKTGHALKAQGERLTRIETKLGVEYHER